MPFSPGQPIVWRFVPRGGYYSRDRYYPVDGIIRKVTPRRVSIEVKRQDGTTVLRNVKPESIKPRP